MRGAYITNGSCVLADDIGENEDALFCHTDKISCCRSSREGEWYFPNGSQVGIEGNAYNFFYRNRDNTGQVRLNHRGNSIERGLFNCQVPNENGVIQTLNVYIYVCKLVCEWENQYTVSLLYTNSSE